MTMMVRSPCFESIDQGAQLTIGNGISILLHILDIDPIATLFPFHRKVLMVALGYNQMIIMADNDQKRDYCINAMKYTQNWDTWKSTLKEAITVGKGMGLSDAEIKDIATKFTDFLSDRVCAETAEEELLKDMWDSADVDERKAIVSIFFKMLSKEM